MRKKSYRRVLPLILVLSIIFVFTACTTRNTNPNQTNDLGQQNGTTDRTGRQNGLQQQDNTGQNLMGENQQGMNPEVNRMGTPDNALDRTQNELTNGINNGTNNQTLMGRDGAVAPPEVNTKQTRTTQLQQNTLADNGRRAENIREKLETISGIDDVSVVVTGNTAIVGYRLTDRSKNAATIKNEIAKKVKDTDKAIENVSVTDAADLSAQLKRISEDIKNNGPIDEINASIQKIMRQLTPDSR